MQNIVNSNKANLLKKIAYVLAFPIVLTIINVLVLTIFNFGEYMGTFIRHLFDIVVCWKWFLSNHIIDFL